jgi:hypothetical protein
MDVLVKPMEFAEAVAKVKNRLPVGGALDTEGWSRQALALRENAFFSAKVESARVMSELQGRVLNSATRGEFVAKSRQWLLKNGFARATNQRDLRQLTSTRRLELIFEHNSEAARGYGWWKQGQDPDVLDAFPAQEFLRIESRKEPRMDWERRWTAAGGRVFGGRMIALKSDPVWRGLSRFGTPWPPFDFGSGMGVEDVSREEAEDLGLLQPDEPVTGDEKDFNEAVERSAKDLTPERTREVLDTFDDDVTLHDGKLQWTGQRLVDLWRSAVGTGPKSFTDVDKHVFGVATTEAVSVARRDLGIDLRGWKLEVRAQELRHIARKHGQPGDVPGGIGERHMDQRPITEAEIRSIPVTWRTPTRMEWAPDSLPRLQDSIPEGWAFGAFWVILEIDGRMYLGQYVADLPNGVLRVGTMWVKKEGGQP